MSHVSDDRSETLDEAATKRLRKMEKGLDTRALDPWERYRALSDLHDAIFDMAELADRKARFALIMMGALNALNIVIGAQRVLGDDAASVRPILGLYFTGYAAVSLYFFVQAIQTLRPRMSLFPENPVPAKKRAGLRFIGDIIDTSDEEYYQRWSDVQVGQLCREVASHVQVLARITDLKFRALDRVYKGLMAMTALSALMVTALAFYRMTH